MKRPKEKTLIFPDRVVIRDLERCFRSFHISRHDFIVQAIREKLLSRRFGNVKNLKKGEGGAYKSSGVDIPVKLYKVLRKVCRNRGVYETPFIIKAIEEKVVKDRNDLKRLNLIF